MLQCIGLGINFKKSALKLFRILEHLGFSQDSAGKTVSLPQTKRNKILTWFGRLLNSSGCTTEELFSLLGTLESVWMTIILAALHFCGLQFLIPRPGCQGDLQPKLWHYFSAAAMTDLHWWDHSINSSSHSSTSGQHHLSSGWTRLA